MAVNIEYFLKQKYDQYGLQEMLRTEELYNDINNRYLKKLFAILHQEFNRLFSFMYKKTNGHFNANESRELDEYIKLYEDMKYVLKETPLSFEIDKSYGSFIEECKGFLVLSGGSEIPKDLKKVQLIEYEPIFIMTRSVKIVNRMKEKRYPIHLIGEGSYAKVFKYTDEFYNKTFVIKQAKKDLNQKKMERFKKEYQTLKELKSPYILEVYSYDEEKNEYYAEYADQTLYDFINKNNNNITNDIRINIVYQLFKAFSYIHRKGYLHRDISLTNVLLKKYDEVIIVKISDFGLVKEKNSNLTSTDSDVKGSLNDSNLAIVGFKNYSIEYETYALTRVIYFVMTGKTNLEKNINEKLKEFVLKGTNHNIDSRFKSINEMKEFFKRIINN